MITKEEKRRAEFYDRVKKLLEDSKDIKGLTLGDVYTVLLNVTQQLAASSHNVHEKREGGVLVGSKSKNPPKNLKVIK